VPIVQQSQKTLDPRRPRPKDPIVEDPSRRSSIVSTVSNDTVQSKRDGGVTPTPAQSTGRITPIIEQMVLPRVATDGLVPQGPRVASEQADNFLTLHREMFDHRWSLNQYRTTQLEPLYKEKHQMLVNIKNLASARTTAAARTEAAEELAKQQLIQLEHQINIKEMESQALSDKAERAELRLANVVAEQDAMRLQISHVKSHIDSQLTEVKDGIKSIEADRKSWVQNLDEGRRASTVSNNEYSSAGREINSLINRLKEREREIDTIIQLQTRYSENERNQNDEIKKLERRENRNFDRIEALERGDKRYREDLEELKLQVQELQRRDKRKDEEILRLQLQVEQPSGKLPELERQQRIYADDLRGIEKLCEDLSTRIQEQACILVECQNPGSNPDELLEALGAMNTTLSKTVDRCISSEKQIKELQISQPIMSATSISNDPGSHVQLAIAGSGIETTADVSLELLSKLQSEMMPFIEIETQLALKNHLEAGPPLKLVSEVKSELEPSLKVEVEAQLKAYDSKLRSELKQLALDSTGYIFAKVFEQHKNSSVIPAVDKKLEDLKSYFDTHMKSAMEDLKADVATRLDLIEVPMDIERSSEIATPRKSAKELEQSNLSHVHAQSTIPHFFESTQAAKSLDQDVIYQQVHVKVEKLIMTQIGQLEGRLKADKSTIDAVHRNLEEFNLQIKDFVTKSYNARFGKQAEAIAALQTDMEKLNTNPQAIAAMETAMDSLQQKVTAQITSHTNELEGRLASLEKARQLQPSGLVVDPHQGSTTHTVAVGVATPHVSDANGKPLAEEIEVIRHHIGEIQHRLDNTTTAHVADMVTNNIRKQYPPVDISFLHKQISAMHDRVKTLEGHYSYYNNFLTQFSQHNNKIVARIQALESKTEHHIPPVVEKRLSRLEEDVRNSIEINAITAATGSSSTMDSKRLDEYSEEVKSMNGRIKSLYDIVTPMQHEQILQRVSELERKEDLLRKDFDLSINLSAKIPQPEATSLETIVENLKRTVNSEALTQRELSGKIETLSNRIEIVEDNIKHDANRRNTQASSITRLNKAVTGLEEGHENLRSQLDQSLLSEDGVTGLKKYVEMLQLRLNDIEPTVAQYSKDLTDVTEQVSSKYTILDAKISAARTKFQTGLDDHTMKLNQLDQEVSTVEKQCEKLEAELRTTTNETNQIKNKLSSQPAKPLKDRSNGFRRESGYLSNGAVKKPAMTLPVNRNGVVGPMAKLSTSVTTLAPPQVLPTPQLTTEKPNMKQEGSRSPPNLISNKGKAAQTVQKSKTSESVAMNHFNRQKAINAATKKQQNERQPREQSVRQPGERREVGQANRGVPAEDEYVTISD
jgi:chromosome segregation ATPase